MDYYFFCDVCRTRHSIMEDCLADDEDEFGRPYEDDYSILNFTHEDFEERALEEDGISPGSDLRDQNIFRREKRPSSR